VDEFLPSHERKRSEFRSPCAKDPGSTVRAFGTELSSPTSLHSTELENKRTILRLLLGLSFLGHTLCTFCLIPHRLCRGCRLALASVGLLLGKGPIHFLFPPYLF